MAMNKKSFAGAAVALFFGLLSSAPSFGSSEEVELKSQDWTFSGAFGTYDRAQQQRGFQVFKEVCSSCHSLKYVAFRSLAGIGLGEEQIEAIAAEYEVQDEPDEYGEVGMRAALPSDYWPGPFANEKAARFSNNGALPPDLSLMAKARAGGPDYIYSLLTGYDDPPADFEVDEGLHYNAYFPGHQIAMFAPLFDDAVLYEDGTPATVDQMAQDVAVFLNWAAEPELEARHELGFKVVIFLIFLTVLLHFSNKAVWADIKGKKKD